MVRVCSGILLSHTKNEMMPLHQHGWICTFQSLSCVWLCATPRTVALQALLSRRFSRQEYWSGLPFFPSGDLPNPGIKPISPVSPSLAGRFFTTEPPGKRFWDDSHILYSDMGLYYMFICKRLWSFVHFTVCKFHPPSQTVNQEALKGNWTDIINLLWNASKSKTDWWMDIDKASIMKCKW